MVFGSNVNDGYVEDDNMPMDELKHLGTIAATVKSSTLVTAAAAAAAVTTTDEDDDADEDEFDFEDLEQSDNDDDDSDDDDNDDHGNSKDNSNIVSKKDLQEGEEQWKGDSFSFCALSTPVRATRNTKKAPFPKENDAAPKEAVASSQKEQLSDDEEIEMNPSFSLCDVVGMSKSFDIEETQDPADEEAVDSSESVEKIITEKGAASEINSAEVKEKSFDVRISLPFKPIFHQPTNALERQDSTVNSSRNIEFREPYPPLQSLAKPRASHDIVQDHKVGGPQRPVRWSMPKCELNELLLAAKGSSLVRRSNACGALKVLTMKSKNQMMLCRTEGFLETIILAAQAEIAMQDKEAALDARTRAVTALYQVSIMKENREIVASHPELLECLVKVMKDDDGEARVYACAALAMLAKTSTNREGMVEVKDLVASLGRVLGGTRGVLSSRRIIKQVKTYDAVVDKKKAEGDESNDDSNGSMASYTSSIDDDTLDNTLDAHSLEFDDNSLSTNSEDDFFSDNSSMGSSPKGMHAQNSIREANDGKQEEFMSKAKMNACAALTHLSKHCAIVGALCANEVLLENLLAVCVDFESPIHTRCLEILCNLSRFPVNTAILAHNEAAVHNLVKCTRSKSVQDRIWSLRSLQNLSSDASSKVILAKSTILAVLSTCAMRKDHDEQVAAVATLYNLSTEAGTIVPITNTTNVVATLVYLAHNSSSHPSVRQMACDTLATIGLWLQTLATSGTVPEDVEKVLLPSHSSSGWDRWD